MEIGNVFLVWSENQYLLMFQLNAYPVAAPCMSRMPHICRETIIHNCYTFYMHREICYRNRYCLFIYCVDARCTPKKPHTLAHCILLNKWNDQKWQIIMIYITVAPIFLQITYWLNEILMMILSMATAKLICVATYCLICYYD